MAHIRCVELMGKRGMRETKARIQNPSLNPRKPTPNKSYRNVAVSSPQSYSFQPQTPNQSTLTEVLGLCTISALVLIRLTPQAPMDSGRGRCARRVFGYCTNLESSLPRGCLSAPTTIALSRTCRPHVGPRWPPPDASRTGQQAATHVLQAVVPSGAKRISTSALIGNWQIALKSKTAAEIVA